MTSFVIVFSPHPHPPSYFLNKNLRLRTWITPQVPQPVHAGAIMGSVTSESMVKCPQVSEPRECEITACRPPGRLAKGPLGNTHLDPTRPHLPLQTPTWLCSTFLVLLRYQTSCLEIRHLICKYPREPALGHRWWWGQWWGFQNSYGTGWWGLSHRSSLSSISWSPTLQAQCWINNLGPTCQSEKAAWAAWTLWLWCCCFESLVWFLILFLDKYIF